MVGWEDQGEGEGRERGEGGCGPRQGAAWVLGTGTGTLDGTWQEWCTVTTTPWASELTRELRLPVQPVLAGAESPSRLIHKPAGG